MYQIDEPEDVTIVRSDNKWLIIRDNRARKFKLKYLDKY